MKFRTFNLVVAACTFILGSAYVLADQASVTANVVGYSGSAYAIGSVIGLFLIIASAAFFMITIHSNIDMDLEHLVHRGKKNTHIQGTTNEEYYNEVAKSVNVEEKK